MLPDTLTFTTPHSQLSQNVNYYYYKCTLSVHNTSQICILSPKLWTSCQMSPLHLQPNTLQ